MSTLLLLECAVARYQSVHASSNKAVKQRVKDVYGADRAKDRNDHGPEPTTNFELYEPEGFVQSEGPGLRH